MTSSIIFAVTGIIHFLINVGVLVASCDCPLTLFAGMAYGGLFVPAVLVLNKKRSKITTCIILSLCGCLSFAGAAGIRMLYILCYERLLFMSFIHGFVVPGMIVSGTQLAS